MPLIANFQIEMRTFELFKYLLSKHLHQVLWVKRIQFMLIL